MAVLSRFHLTIDFPHKRVLFEQPVDEITPFTINHAGLTTRSEERGWLILHVAAKSPAALSGLAAGDVIVMLNGAPLDEARRKDWQNGPVGTKVSVRLSDGHEVTLTLASYF
ncbi:MAG: PDZ domain-containing protein [Oxalobacteraceae bacterium]|nr:MAG: PDZ domain-containing protein [Oxalobacteraceae bacterium]